MNGRHYPRRLIEVDLPIKRISAHARREKSIRHGHISTLHIWWARRPLAACRAVVCAALRPDPADPLCPQAFRDAANHIITGFARKVCGQGKIGTPNLSATCSEESRPRWEILSKPGEELDAKDEAHLNVLRFALLDFIADFANWDNSTVPEYLETARALTQAAHEGLGGEPGTRPLVVDPFAGGGSIPLEALRVGADAFASDLNPVAVLLNKVVLEYIPKYGQKLADEVRKWGTWIKVQAEKELAVFYPKDPDGATPIAYLWARTVTCEGPSCGAEVPLMRSLWLAKKGERSVGLRLVPRPRAKRVDYEVIDNAKAKDVGEGTVKRGSATCPVCGFTTPVASVRRQLKERQGGAADARLYCVVRTRPGEQGRFYRLPAEADLVAIRKAATELKRRQRAHIGLLSLVPDEQLDVRGIRHTWAMIYGFDTWGRLFTPRQALALSTLCGLVREVWCHLKNELNDGLAVAVESCLALCLDRVADLANSLCGWKLDVQCPTHLFARQAVPMVWDFSESVCLSESSGSWTVMTERFTEILSAIGSDWLGGDARCASATEQPLPDHAAHAVITDPPYYDAVPYAYLSEFFYVWLRRCLAEIHPELFQLKSVPKDAEIVVDRPHELSQSTKDIAFYERELTKAFREGCRILRQDGIAVIVFASKTTASWEAILQAVVDAGWTITGSWPIDTEMETRVAAQGQARLASSVHLVCRPRVESSIGDWRDVLAELPKRIHEWMPRLGAEGVVGADAIFACLGPALEVFSRYRQVEKASGDKVELKEYLEQVWATVAKEALSMILHGTEASGFEEDARLSVIWFWVLKAATPETEDQTSNDEESETEEEGGKTSKPAKVSGWQMEYDAVRKLAQGLGADLAKLSRPTGIIAITGKIAVLRTVHSRESVLLGIGRKPSREEPLEVQRNLFGESVPAPRLRRKRKPGEPKVAMKSVTERQADLTDEPTGETGNLFATIKDQRTLLDRLVDCGVTLLDRLHQAMLLFGMSQTALLGPFLTETGMAFNLRFWRLAQALSALYPPGTEEKRWVDGVLGRKKGLGF